MKKRSLRWLHHPAEHNPDDLSGTTQKCLRDQLTLGSTQKRGTVEMH